MCHSTVLCSQNIEACQNAAREAFTYTEKQQPHMLFAQAVNLWLIMYKCTHVYHTCLPHFTINLAAKITPTQFLNTVLRHKHVHGVVGPKLGKRVKDERRLREEKKE